uniref:39S ribosomal protein L33, mitochondrial n=1 Tax=Timema tahoe TaxID=61484 RepID=A0A7R9ID59_9NEOP|nr:unnamed protein product [Timema tahoe]
MASYPPSIPVITRKMGGPLASFPWWEELVPSPELPGGETRGGGLIRFPRRCALTNTESVVSRGVPCSPHSLPHRWRCIRPLSKTLGGRHEDVGLLCQDYQTRNVMVLLESVVSGHKYIQIRERLAEKMEVIMFDPYIRQDCVYRERKKIRSVS